MFLPTEMALPCDNSINTVCSSLGLTSFKVKPSLMNFNLSDLYYFKFAHKVRFTNLLYLTTDLQSLIT